MYYKRRDTFTNKLLMIEFKELTVDDKEIITSFTFPNNRMNCDLSFSNLLSWRFLYETKYAIVDNFLVLRFRDNGKLSYIMPVGKGDMTSTLNKIIDDAKNVYFAICKQESDKLIGYSSINNIDIRNLKAEWGGTQIGDKEFIGKGYGREASGMMLRFLFDQYPVNRCYAYCLEEHPATPKLFTSLGFQREGTLRKDIF